MVVVEAAEGARRGERVALVREPMAVPGDTRALLAEPLRGAGAVALTPCDRRGVA
jgi:hypothetical protein